MLFVLPPGAERGPQVAAVDQRRCAGRAQNKTARQSASRASGASLCSVPCACASEEHLNGAVPLKVVVATSEAASRGDMKERFALKERDAMRRRCRS